MHKTRPAWTPCPTVMCDFYHDLVFGQVQCMPACHRVRVHVCVCVATEMCMLDAKGVKRLCGINIHTGNPHWKQTPTNLGDCKLYSLLDIANCTVTGHGKLYSLLQMANCTAGHSKLYSLLQMANCTVNWTWQTVQFIGDGNHTANWRRHCRICGTNSSAGTIQQLLSPGRL